MIRTQDRLDHAHTFSVRLGDAIALVTASLTLVAVLLYACGTALVAWWCA